MKKKFKILVTAGPTQEMIDPVRFISNRSTGVMGYEIARAAKGRGHKVTLISGPAYIRQPRGVKFIPIQTVGELKKATLSHLRDADCLFMAAAVSDWRILGFRKDKIRRGGKTLKLLLKPTPDILALAGKRKGKRILIGFSLETGNAIASAKKKLKNKNLDIIVLNKLEGTKNPFGNRRVKISIIYKTAETENLPLLSKSDIAKKLLDRVERTAQWPRR